MTNIGPHRQLDVSFKRGLVGIIGANGAGKSTLVDAPYALLTGDWGRFEGKNSSNINDLADSEEYSGGSLEAEHEGTVFTVERGLRPVSCRLEIVGEMKVYTKDADIRRELETRLGLNRRLLNDYVFVRQRGMFGFLDETPAKRAESFAHLCRTTRTAEAFKACGQVIDSLGKDDVVIEESDSLQAAIRAVEAELTGIATRIADHETCVLSVEDMTKAKAILEHHRLYELHTDRLIQLQEQLTAALALETERRSALAETFLELKAALEQVTMLKPFAEAVATAQRDWARYDDWVARGEALKRRLRQLQTQGATYKKPDLPPGGLVSVPELTEERTRLRADLDAAGAVLQVFDESGLTACPTCGTPVKGFEARIVKAKAAAQQLPARIKTLSVQLKAAEQYNENLQVYQREYAAHQAQLKAVERQHAEFFETPEAAPGVSRDVDKNAVAAYKTAEAAHTQLGSRFNARQSAVFQAEAQVQSLQKAVGTEQDTVTSHRVSTKRFNEATLFLKEHEDALTALAPLREQVRTGKAKLASLTEDLKRSRTLQARFSKRKRAIGLLTRLRDDVFHHSKLAHIVASGNLAAVEDDLNAQLVLLGSPFRAEIGDGLSFQVVFPGAPPRPAERLSGGQKGVFAMAFRPAFASLFGADNGMMVLDEPTDGLDAANLLYMRDALSALASSVRGRRQILVVTHAESLLPAFDQVVRIGG